MIRPESSAFWASKGMVSRVRASDCFQTRLNRQEVAALFLASISASLGRALEPLAESSLSTLAYARGSAGLTEAATVVQTVSAQDSSRARG